MNVIEFCLITGLSGSGKSTAVKCFEDLGFFCIENLPVKLIPVFIDLCRESDEAIHHVAAIIDLRDRELLCKIERTLKWLRSEKIEIRLLFLEASDEALIRRFTQTRRPHPLAEEGSIIEAIQEERNKLAHLRERSDTVIDTSEFNIHQLRKCINDLIAPRKSATEISVTLLSFGYKFGIPLEADLVFDVRFLANPFFTPGLRNLTGRNKKVIKFLETGKEFKEFNHKLEEFLLFLLPSYRREGKSYLTIAIGCTGGRHRSVAVAEKIHALFRKRGYNISTRHRDIGKHYPPE